MSGPRDDLADLNLIELLDRLEPVPEPSAISMAPQTIGWVWAAAVLVIMALFLWRYVARHKAAQRYRQDALQELAGADGNPAEIALIVRRTALVAYPRSTVASLHGQPWLEFLDQSYGGDEFVSGPGRVIAEAPYSPPGRSDGLESVVRDWIVRHRPSQDAAQ